MKTIRVQKTELLARLGEAALEALDAATGIDQLLLAGVEGWHLLQTSTWISGLVSRVWITLPQAQVMVQST